jgi:hypothetical protein
MLRHAETTFPNATSRAGRSPAFRLFAQCMILLVASMLATCAICEGAAAQDRAVAQTTAVGRARSAGQAPTGAQTEAQSAAPAQAESAPAQASSHSGGADPDTPAWLHPVDELNEILPHWLRMGGEYRDRFEGPQGVGFAPARDAYLLDRLRVNAAVQPKSWLLFYGEVQDARIFFNDHVATSVSYQDTWTLWQAYPQLGSSTSGWIDVLAGRQVLRFGDERVIGPSPWNNVGRTFNVARLDLHHPGFKVSLFSAAVVPAGNAFLHGTIPGDDLHAIYASFENAVPHAVFEPYVLRHVASAGRGLAETVGRGHLNEVTLGLHLKGTLPRDFEYDTEWDAQTGTLGPDSIGAWAGYAGFAKRFTAPLRPRIFAEANAASGTKNLAGTRWSTFDQLYPSNHDKYGFADLAGRRNLEQARAGVEEAITAKWAIRQAFEGLWLFTSGDNFYASSGAVSVAAHPGANRHIGNELDLTSTYEIDKGLHCGFGYARLFAGAFLKTASQGHDYGYPYAYVEYNFSRGAVQ